VLFFRPIDIETHSADGLEIGFRRGYERVNRSFPLFGRVRIPVGVYKSSEGILELTTSLHRSVSSYLEIRYGEFYGGTRLRVWGRVDWRPNRFVRIGVEYDHNELKLDVVQDVRPATVPVTTRVVSDRVRSRVARLRLNLQFNPDVSWLTFVQYDNASDKIGINTRLRWIVEDGREIFVVFNQTLLSEDGSIRNGATEPLAKVGWTFRF
jgi:hypothetical protein